MNSVNNPSPTPERRTELRRYTTTGVGKLITFARLDYTRDDKVNGHSFVIGSQHPKLPRFCEIQLSEVGAKLLREALDLFEGQLREERQAIRNRIEEKHNRLPKYRPGVLNGKRATP